MQLTALEKLELLERKNSNNQSSAERRLAELEKGGSNSQSPAERRLAELEARGSNNSTGYIDPKYRYHYDDDIVSKAIKSIDYPVNIVRSGVHAIQTGNSPIKWMKEAFDEKRHVDVRHIKNSMGIGELGKNDGEFQFGDIIDFTGEAVLDTVLDPLTYATLGTSAIAKGLGKSVLTGAKTATAAKIGSKLAKANTFLPEKIAKETSKLTATNVGKALLAEEGAKTVGAATMGGIYGWNVSDKDDSLSEKIRNASAGALGTTSLRGLYKGLSPYGREYLEKFSDGLANNRGIQFGIDSVSKAKSLARDTIRRVDTKVVEVMQNFNTPLSKLTPIEKAGFWSRYDDASIEYVKHRNELWSKEVSSIMRDKDKAAEFVGDDNFWRNKAKGLINIDPTAAEIIGLDDIDELSDHNIIKSFSRLNKKRGIENGSELLEQLGLKTTEGGTPIPKYGTLKSQEALLLGKDVTKRTNEVSEGILGKHFSNAGENINTAVKEYQARVPQMVRELNEFQEPLFREEAISKGIKSQKEIDKYVDSRLREPIDIYAPTIAKKDAIIFSPDQKMVKAEKRYKAKSADTEESLRDILGRGKNGNKLSDEQYLKERKASIEIYAKNQAKMFMSANEAENMMKVAKYSNPDDTKTELLRMYDNSTAMMKSTVLLGSLKWVAMNHFDNSVKAITERGLLNGLNTFIPNNANIIKDIKNLVTGVTKVDFNEPLTKYAVDSGLLDSNMVKELTNREVVSGGFVDYAVNPVVRKEIEASKNARKNTMLGKINSKLESGLDWVNGIQTAKYSIGTASTFVENYAKLITMKNAYDANRYAFMGKGDSKLFSKLVDGFKKGDPNLADDAARMLAEDELKQSAMLVAKDTYFDYSDSMNYFEDQIVKRMIPFWSFTKNNLEYWSDALVDTTKASRINRIDRITRGPRDEHRPFTEFERRGLSDYLNGQRLVKKYQDGHKMTVSVGRSLSHEQAIKQAAIAVEAWKNTKDDPVTKAVVENMNPLIKSIYEFAWDEDTFQGGPFNPSSIQQGYKYLYSRGYMNIVAQDVIKMATGKENVLGTTLDENGDPIMTSDAIAKVDHIMKFLSLIPYHKTFEQVVSQWGKVKFKGKKVKQAVVDLVSPIQDTDVTMKSIRYQNSYKDGNAKKDKIREVKLGRHLEELRKKNNDPERHFFGK